MCGKKILLSLAFILLPLSLFAATSNETIIKGDQTSWDRKKNTLEATGNAEVHKEDVTLKADHLAAQMEPKKDKKIAAASGNLKRADAMGNVEIMSSDGTLTGEKAFYDVPRDYMELDGKLIRITGPKGTLYTTPMLSYKPQAKTAFLDYPLWGLYDGKFLRADGAKIMFSQEKNQNSKQGIDAVEAKHHVVLISPNERGPAYVVRADEMRYDGKDQQADLWGNMVLTQGENILVGSHGHADLQKGQHILVQEKGSVYGLFYTKKKG